MQVPLAFSVVATIVLKYPMAVIFNHHFHINTCCYNRVTRFANVSYIRATRHIKVTICRLIVLSTLFRRILLSEIAQIASSECKTHIYNCWEG